MEVEAGSPPAAPRDGQDADWIGRRRRPSRRTVAAAGIGSRCSGSAPARALPRLVRQPVTVPRGALDSTAAAGSAGRSDPAGPVVVRRHVSLPALALRLWPWLVMAALFNGALVAVLVLRPGGYALDNAIDDLVSIAAPLLVLPLCWGSRDTARTPALGRFPLLIGLGLLSQALGEAVWTGYDLVLHSQVPSPSWADLGYLGVYPLWLAAILALPSSPLSRSARTRAVLDGLMAVIAAATVSWSFILGPTILSGDATLASKLVSAAYPLGDLLLLASLCVLAVRNHDPSLRIPLALLAAGLGVWTITDTVYLYQTVQGMYDSMQLLDAGWPIAEMLIGLAVGAVRVTSVRRPSAVIAGAGDGSAGDATPSCAVDPNPPGEPEEPPTAPVRLLLPYALMPAVALLLVVAWRGGDDPRLRAGVVAGSVVLIGLLLFRQVLALLEQARLYAALRHAHREQECLHEISRQLNAATSLDDVLDIAYDGLRTGLGYDRVGIDLIDYEAGIYREARGTDDLGRKTIPVDRATPLGPDSIVWRLPGISNLLDGARLYFSENVLDECPEDSAVRAGWAVDAEPDGPAPGRRPARGHHLGR